ncbi:hypothetical protein Tcan_07565 [Toxocara canis]|uniref:UPAR/Ly6 domain-containing protein n=1 Tax=Toxocara canis TaxID=6265 RepID=A0A0B2VJ22_TOXCA|nr:hypothetical protein Tcan_07565 [Toxocara canis]
MLRLMFFVACVSTAFSVRCYDDTQNGTLVECNYRFCLSLYGKDKEAMDGTMITLRSCYDAQREDFCSKTIAQSTSYYIQLDGSLLKYTCCNMDGCNKEIVTEPPQTTTTYSTTSTTRITSSAAATTTTMASATTETVEPSKASIQQTTTSAPTTSAAAILSRISAIAVAGATIFHALL